MEKFYLFLNGLILLFLTTLPILILFIGIKSTIKMKGQNKPICSLLRLPAINADFLYNLITSDRLFADK